MAEDLRRFLDDEPIQARCASSAERYARWARRHPAIAVLGAMLSAVLVLATVGSLMVAAHMARLAEAESHAAQSERLAHQEADQARAASERLRAAAEGETYNAVLSETKALGPGIRPAGATRRWPSCATRRHAHRSPRPGRATH